MIIKRHCKIGCYLDFFEGKNSYVSILTNGRAINYTRVDKR